MENGNDANDNNNSDDRTTQGKFVDIPDNADIYTGRLCVGRVISDKYVKSSVVHNVLQQAWGRYVGVRVQELSGEVILFEFEKPEDLEDALDWSPWAIQGNCLSLKRWQLGMRMRDVQFYKIQFWVQIHGLEVGKFSKQNAESIGESLGTVLEVDEVLGPMGLDMDFVRIKVEIDARSPLQAGFWYRRGNGDMGRATIK